MKINTIHSTETARQTKSSKFKKNSQAFDNCGTTEYQGERERTNDDRPIFPASVGLPAYINPFQHEIHPFGEILYCASTVQAMTCLVSSEAENRDSEGACDVQTIDEWFQKKGIRSDEFSLLKDLYVQAACRGLCKRLLSTKLSPDRVSKIMKQLCAIALLFLSGPQANYRTQSLEELSARATRCSGPSLQRDLNGAQVRHLNKEPFI